MTLRDVAGDVIRRQEPAQARARHLGRARKALRTDRLTGLRNRLGWDEALDEAMFSASRSVPRWSWPGSTSTAPAMEGPDPGGRHPGTAAGAPSPAAPAACPQRGPVRRLDGNVLVVALSRCPRRWRRILERIRTSVGRPDVLGGWTVWNGHGVARSARWSAAGQALELRTERGGNQMCTATHGHDPSRARLGAGSAAVAGRTTPGPSAAPARGAAPGQGVAEDLDQPRGAGACRRRRPRCRPGSRSGPGSAARRRRRAGHRSRTSRRGSPRAVSGKSLEQVAQGVERGGLPLAVAGLLVARRAAEAVEDPLAVDLADPVGRAVGCLADRGGHARESLTDLARLGEDALGQAVDGVGELAEVGGRTP